MENNKTLIAKDKIQVIHDCIINAEQERLDYELRHPKVTNNARSSSIWDYMNTNIVAHFTDDKVLYAECKRGMWTLLIFYDSTNNLLVSFMKEERFKKICTGDGSEQPQYIQALLKLNDNYRSKFEQQSMFIDDCTEVGVYINRLLNSICDSFTNPVDKGITNHVLVVFSTEELQLTTLKAYIINPYFDIVYEENWLDLVKPMVPEITFERTQENSLKVQPKLTEKAAQRTHEKEMVSLKQKEVSVKPAKQKQ